MNLLIFEYATATGIKDPSITAEGFAMLKGLTSDLGKNNSSYLISKHSEPINGINCNPIVLEIDLCEWIGENIPHYDFCLPIAPEEDFILYKLTKLIEEKGVKIVGSSSDAVCTCSDKYLTFKALENKVPIIPTTKVPFNEINELNDFNTFFNDLETKMVVKPADGVSSSAVYVVNSLSTFKNAALRVKEVTNLPYFLLQEWVEGDSVSVSLLSDGNKATPLSLNGQNISLNDGRIRYDGGKVPFNHPKSDEVKKIAVDAVESISGLKGYVGVDMIIGDQIHVVEINSRITTPYVALRNLLDFNLGQAILDSVQGRLIEEEKIQLKGEIEFTKIDDHLNLKVVG